MARLKITVTGTVMSVQENRERFFSALTDAVETDMAYAVTETFVDNLNEIHVVPTENCMGGEDILGDSDLETEFCQRWFNLLSFVSGIKMVIE